MKIGKTKTLNNGVEMPYLGLGVYRSGAETYKAVRIALDAGYKHIDTASFYENERDVGKAVKDSGIDRSEIFITTKVWNSDIRADHVIEACHTSLKNLDVDFIDLYLIHWPVPGKYIEAYKACETLYAQKKLRSIGLSNHLKPHLDKLLPVCDILPAANQLEIHPYLSNTSEINYCIGMNIFPIAWAPLAVGRVLKESIIDTIAKKYSKTPAQIVLRWHIQRGVAVIPKSVNPERIVENTAIFDFELAPLDMASIDSLNKDKRDGPDPLNFNF
ncbi:MAG: aldo/keto reductase [Christensenellaceae bacterium]|nr:aldo/keto reductase [Christensenellaceae bacterium]